MLTATVHLLTVGDNEVYLHHEVFLIFFLVFVAGLVGARS